MSIRLIPTTELNQSTALALRAMLDVAFEGRLSQADWEHALGGIHIVAVVESVCISHAAVVPRTLWVDGVAWATGYVEAVATTAAYRRQGYGSGVMREATRQVTQAFSLGALCTGRHGFYTRFGWQRWHGATSVRLPSAEDERTGHEDGTVMVLRTPASQAIDPTAPIACDWRHGDVW